MNKVLVIANPVSGRAGSLILLNELKGQRRGLFCERLGLSTELEFEIVITDREGRWKEKASRFMAGNPICTVAIGGDGTLADVSTFLALQPERRWPLFAIPGGRGNDFIRGFYGFAGRTSEFWDWLERQGRPWQKYPVDIADGNGRIFLNMASIGYGGGIVEKAHTRKAIWSKTKLVYQVEGALALFNRTERRCLVRLGSSAGDVVYDGSFFGAFVGNGRANGAGLFWTPNARLDDGKVDTIVFARPNVFELAKTLSEIKKGAAPTFVHKRFVASDFVFEFDQEVPIELDGEYVGSFKNYAVKVLPSALTFWGP